MTALPTMPPWMLIPGHMCDARMWSGVRPALQAVGLETIDADLTQDDSVDGMARRALSVLQRPTVLVGFSMGGMVALRMCALAPDRIAGLVLVDSNARPDLPERSEMRLRQQREARQGGLRRIVHEEMAPHYFATCNPARADLTELIQAMGEALGPAVFLRQSEAIRLRPDARSAAREIRKPALVIGGAEDGMSLPEWQRDMASSIAGADCILIDGIGHFAPLEAVSLVLDSTLAWARFHKLLPATDETRPRSQV